MTEISTVTTEENSLHVIHQPCRNCVFAVYDGKTQTDCSQGRLEKFREEDENSVISAQDGELEFEIVNGRPCVYFRDRYDEWARQYSPENYAAQVRKEVIIRTDAVVVLSGKNLKAKQLLADLKITLDSLKAQILSTQSVYIISNQDAVPIPKLHSFLIKEGKGLNWNMTNILLRTEIGDRVDPLAAIDETFSKFRGHFYCVLAPGFVLPDKFCLDIDRSVNDRVNRFAVLEPVDGWNCLTIQNGFHKAFDGHNLGYGQDTRKEEKEGDSERTLLKNALEKARYFSKIYDKPSLVQKAEDICEALRK